jgi:acetylornithine deacetylase/succinyl-diaminopimelate desuccinylase-like protein
MEELRRVIDDPGIEIEQIMAFTPASSSVDTEVYEAIETVTREHFTGAAIVPSVAAGFTDSHFFRDLGMAAYGYSPIVIPLEDLEGVHGNNERVSVENVRRGTGIMREIVERVVHGP